MDIHYRTLQNDWGYRKIILVTELDHLNVSSIKFKDGDGGTQLWSQSSGGWGKSGAETWYWTGKKALHLVEFGRQGFYASGLEGISSKSPTLTEWNRHIYILLSAVKANSKLCNWLHELSHTLSGRISSRELFIIRREILGKRVLIQTGRVKCVLVCIILSWVESTWNILEK